MTRRVVFVTGGAGFIGSNVVARLAHDPSLDVVVCDWLGEAALAKWRTSPSTRSPTSSRRSRCLSGWGATPHDVELVIHMGAISSTTEPDADRIVQTNFVLSRDLWNWGAEHRRRLLYASSAATYGDGAGGFDDDNDSGGAGGAAAAQRLRLVEGAV